MSAVVVGTVGAGVALVGGAFSAREQRKGIESASQTSAAASRKAQETQMQMFEQQRADVEPWRQAGITALGRLEQMAGETPTGAMPELELPSLPSLEEVAETFKDLPGYKERFASGIAARDASASATGRLGGGGYQKELTKYGQEYASSEFEKAYQRREREYQREMQSALTRYSGDMDRYNLGWQEYFNKMAPYQSLAGVGQTSAQQMGSAALTTGANIAQQQAAEGRLQANLQTQKPSVVGTALTGLGNTAMTFGMLKAGGLLGGDGTSPWFAGQK